MIPTFYVVIPNDAVHEHVWLYSSEQKAVAYAKKLAEQGNVARVYKLVETHFFDDPK
jgi:hypothetical protein